MKIDFKEMGRSLCGVASKYSPEILTGLGVAGMISSIGLAISATPKALRMVENEENKNERGLTKVEVVKVTWKCYVPMFVTGVASIACIIGANSVNTKRNAAIAAAYTVSESALRGYREKVIETLGEEKDREIRDGMSKDRLANSKGENTDTSIFINNSGGLLCYDVAFDRYFRGDVETIKKAQNELNRRMLTEMYVSLNDLYYEIGLKKTNIGDDVGWNIEDGFIDIYFSAQLTEKDEPCIVIDYRISPKHKFSKI